MEACSDYDSMKNSCRAGHVQLTGVCRGVEYSKGCNHCGYLPYLPQCLNEEPPKHLIREDGMPLLWKD